VHTDISHANQQANLAVCNHIASSILKVLSITVNQHKFRRTKLYRMWS